MLKSIQSSHSGDRAGFQRFHIRGLGANVSLFSKAYKERNGGMGDKKLDVGEVSVFLSIILSC